MINRNKGIYVVIILISLLFNVSVAWGDLNFAGELRGEYNQDRYGTVISSGGDINGDGYEELLIGAPGSFEMPDFAGKVFIYLGGKKFRAKPDIVLSGKEPGESFGCALTSLGDINNDGYGDIAVGAHKNSDGGPETGMVYIYFGGTAFDTIPDLTLEGDRPYEWFGISLDGGADLNGDGTSDFIIGASYGGDQGAGCVYLYLPGIDITKPALILNGESAGDCYGNKVAILGDINNDGFTDFGVGLFHYSHDGINNIGRVDIFKGGNIISKDPWLTLKGKQKDEWLGFSLSGVGNVSGDEYADFVVGIPHGGKNEEGVALFYQGGQVLRETPNVSFTGTLQKDLMGYSIARVWDINGDGFEDIAVGSPFNSTGSFKAGRVNFYYGGPAMDTQSDMHIVGDRKNARCGYSITTVRSFFGKGINAFVVSLPGINNSEEGPGRVFLYSIMEGK
ncbi:FG-GAP repeat protein [bacterium]|nr:FG-GAP repeat protein [bacterium]